MNSVEKTSIPCFKLITSADIRPFPDSEQTALDLAPHHKPEPNSPDLLILRHVDESSQAALLKAPDGREVALHANTDTVLQVLFRPSSHNNLLCLVAGMPFTFECEGDTSLIDAVAKRNEQYGFTSKKRRSLAGRKVEIIARPMPRGDSPGKGSREPLPKQLPQPTFIEARQVAYAISDGRDGRNWKGIEGMLGLLHSLETAKHQVRFEPNSLLVSWWGQTPDNAKTLLDELAILDFDAVMTYQVILAGTLYHPKARFTASIDDIIRMIGREGEAKRTAKARQEWRAKVWRWIVIFDSLAVVGARKGYWKEPGSRSETREKMPPEKLVSRDPLFRIVGNMETEQGSFDGSEPPKEVSLVPGEWLMPFHGNREFLAEFGDVLKIAAIPRGKTSGAWAACAGLMLQQIWREGASHATRKRLSQSKEQKANTLIYPAVTRRQLLTKTLRSDNDVNAILDDPKSSHRARDYWKQAVQILKEQKILGNYLEGEETLKGNWRETWLDQPLYMRPADELLDTALEINIEANKARRRGTKRGMGRKTLKES